MRLAEHILFQAPPETVQVHAALGGLFKHYYEQTAA
jgi:hypothetical protein